MNLLDALRTIAERFDLSADALQLFADEDAIGGYGSGFPTGIFAVEGKILYALAAHLAPANVLIAAPEFDCALQHIERAIVAYGGRVTTDKSRGPFDLIFEDMSSEREQVWRYADVAPGGFIVSHDAMHPSAGADVRRDIEAAGYDTLYILVAPSDCGLAIWRASLGVKAMPEPVAIVETAVGYVTENFADSEPEWVVAKEPIPEFQISDAIEIPDEGTYRVTIGQPEELEFVNLDPAVHTPAEIEVISPAEQANVASGDEIMPEPKPAPKKRGRKPKKASQ